MDCFYRRSKFRQRQNALSDKSNALQAAKEEGEKKGKLEAKLEGKLEGKIEMVRRRLEKNHPIDVIAYIADLSIAEVEQIKSDSVSTI